LKKGENKTSVEPRPLTKRQLSRYQRDRMLQRITLIGAAALALLVIGVLAFGVWREILSKPGEVLARVNGKPITAETYAKVLGYAEYNYDLQINQIQDYINQLPPPQPTPTQQSGESNQQSNENSQATQNDPNEFMRQYAQQQLQQLQFRRYTLETDVLDNLIDNELIRAEAARRGLSVTPEEVDKALMDQFAPVVNSTNNENAVPPGEAPAPTGESAAPNAGNATPTVANPTPSGQNATPTAGSSAPIAEGTATTTGTATPAPGNPTTQPVTNTKTVAEVHDELKQALAQTGFLSEADYIYYFVEADLFSQKVQKAIGDEVKTSGEQVHASHILVDTEDDAKKAISMLKDEGRDFASVAKELSKDTQTKDKGGDLGWFPRGVMDPAFEEAAFKLSPGEISDPVKTDYGYHVIRVEERQSDKEISPEYLDALKAKAFDDWLTKEKSPDSKKVEKFDLSDSATWVQSYIDGKRKEMVAKAQQQGQTSNK